VVALLGLTSAVIYGASDFLGGLAARRISALLVTLGSSVVAFVLVGVAVLVERPVWSPSAVLLGAVAGVLGAIGMWAFYACLAVGPMSILSPAVATIYAVVPALTGVALGERFGLPGWIALVAVVVAAGLLAVPRNRDAARVSLRAALLGVAAGLGYAGYIIAIDRTPADSGLAPLLVDLGVSAAVLGIVLGVVHARPAGSQSAGRTAAGFRDPAALRLTLFTGVLLAAANVLLVIALHLGDLAVVGVLNSLYPLGTVALALVVLRERLSRLQTAGVFLAVAGSALLAAG
jgi:drug/metabolite transporter (DMT)-like permease